MKRKRVMKTKNIVCLLTPVLAAIVFAVVFSKDPALSVEKKKSFTVYPVGTVHKNKDETTIEIKEEYQDALLGLDGFSHVWVFWWFDRNDTPERRRVLRVHPRGNRKNPLTGVFATRSPVRPNLIALTLCEIISIEKNIIKIRKTDAFDKTPVLDLKPYIPGYDGKGKADLPGWVTGRHKKKKK
jgi:tRNA-Thr(GGU) m(6)t(6)A37 methyltransferase TsaA